MNGRILRELKKIANDLHPAIKRINRHYTGKQLLEKNSRHTDLKGNPVNPAKMYVIEDVEEINHFEEIKKLYKKCGMQAVGEYVEQQNEDYKNNAL